MLIYLVTGLFHKLAYSDYLNYTIAIPYIYSYTRWCLTMTEGVVQKTMINIVLSKFYNILFRYGMWYMSKVWITSSKNVTQSRNTKIAMVFRGQYQLFYDWKLKTTDLRLFQDDLHRWLLLQTVRKIMPALFSRQNKKYY